jgi:solute:Na+ symporter, SSS family
MGKTALAATVVGTAPPNVDRIIPLFITQAMPVWMTYLFLLTLLSAAMSTLSGQFHLISTSISYDLISGQKVSDRRTLWLARGGTIVGFAVTLVLALMLPPGIIAVATALFFGFCASAFLPMYAAALYWPRVTPAGAIASMLSATISYLTIILFVHEKEAAIFGVCQNLFGVKSLAVAPWTYIDPLIVTLPISAVVLWWVSVVTQPIPLEEIIPQE